MTATRAAEFRGWGGGGLDRTCDIPGSVGVFWALACVLSAALRATHVTLAEADNTS